MDDPDRAPRRAGALPTKHAPAILATLCQHTGRECPMARRFLDRLVRAARLATGASPHLEITGSAEIGGCSRRCGAGYILSARRVELFCGIGPDPDLAELSSYADAFFDGDGPVHRPAGPPPQALLRWTRPPSDPG